MNVCPFCNLNNVKKIRKIKSKLNNKNYVLNNCNNCYIQFFTPLKYENIYETEIFEEYKNFHEGRKYFPEWTKELVHILNKKNLDLTNKKILEIGAGDGINFVALKNNFKIKSENFYALESDKKSIKSCKKSGIKNILNKYFDKNFIFSEKFDMILILEVLEHQTNPREFIDTAIKYLNKDGFIIISVPYSKRSFLKLKENPGDVPPHHFLRFNKRFFKKNFKIFYLNTYISKNKNFLNSAKLISEIIFKNKSFFLLFLPFVFFLRIYDYFNGEGIICIIKKNNL